MRTQEERRGWILAIDNNIAQMIDAATGMSYDVAMSAPGGVLPIPGDQWVCCKEASGFWSFERCVSMRNAQPQTSFRDSMQMLIDRGLVSPSYPDGTNEAYHLAYIGEIRYFPFLLPPNDRWIRADGTFVNRVQYRELAHVLDPLGTSTTFQVPKAIDMQQASSTAWANLGFGTNWGNYDPTGLTFAPVGYRLNGDKVELRGLPNNAINANTQTIVGTLPLGFRPQYQHLFSTISNNLVARIDITTTGVITASAAAANAWIAVDGLSFYVAQPSNLTVKPYVCARK